MKMWGLFIAGQLSSGWAATVVFQIRSAFSGVIRQATHSGGPSIFPIGTLMFVSPTRMSPLTTTCRAIFRVSNIS